MYFFILFISSPVIWSLVVATDPEPHPLSDEFIDIINKKGKWTAGRNFDPDTPMEYITRLMGTDPNYANESALPRKTYSLDLNIIFPETFDARQQWPSCPSLNEIRDQGACGSCWAVAAAAAMTDRYCIEYNGENFHFSAEDLLSCDTGNKGCNGGGNIIDAWFFWLSEGLVSGGNYGSNEGCRPYSIPSSTHTQPTPPCVKACRDGYNVTYKDDKKRGQCCFFMSSEIEMKNEIFLSGPIESVMTVYADFIHYKGGVYEHLSGAYLGAHAVKILGWGVENGKEYWLAANSWGTKWGDKGFFKIKRGINECDIEENCSMSGIFKCFGLSAK